MMKTIRTMRTLAIAVLAIALSGAVSSCKQSVRNEPITQTADIIKHPEWSKNLSIYEVNVRQFSPEGTFAAVESQLPRLKELQTDIIWLMPIHPIGEVERKGSLGSYYAVRDYYGVNPEFGTGDDLKRLINKAHELGLYIIIDWVANHSAWDNALVAEHPEYYKKDSLGNMVSPFDWTDVVAFDYTVKEMGDYMLGAMKYWVEEYNIDGFRCDVAEMVPASFWDKARMELDKIKPVFMLAEGEKPWLHTAFDMSYGWEFHSLKNKVAQGKANANDIEAYLKRNDTLYPEGSYRMYFITNHDENSWNGTEFERMGEGAKAFFVLCATVPGMPLVYTGQESALDKRLEFFERDPVDWKDYHESDFFKTILSLKKSTPALLNVTWGGNWQRIHTTYDAEVFAFIREKDGSKVFVVLNLSPEALTVSFKENGYQGEYTELFTNDTVLFDDNSSIVLTAWDYKVFLSE